MNNNNYKILFVCVANYCRSPVAEKVLNSLLSNNCSADSCGLHPKVDIKMDDRSKEFLMRKNIINCHHIPKKISKYLIDQANVVYAMDISVLQELKKIYKSEKIKLFGCLDKDLYTPDPYRFKNQDYENIMHLINKGCESIAMDLIRD